MNLNSYYLAINNRYVLGRQLGVGSFGEIYLAIDREAKDESDKKLVAVKLEHKNNPVQLLKFEANVYNYLYQANRGIPRMLWSGQQDDYNVLVLEMLGPNLDNLHQLCGRKFSLKTTLLIAFELIKIAQYIHSRGVIHRDIKPENFLIGLNDNNIYIIDFGLCKLFKHKDGSHIPFANNKKMVGTIRYTSLNSHLGNELSRRDDLESIGYMLIYFIKGTLPWQGLGHKSTPRDQKYHMIYECKKNTSIEKLCQGLPKEFTMYMEHVKGLEFNEKPNYNYLYNLFVQLFKRHKYQYDNVYDWNAVRGQAHPKQSNTEHKEAMAGAMATPRPTETPRPK